MQRPICPPRHFAPEGSSAKITGEVLLLKEDGAWRIDDEIAVTQ